MFFTRGSSVIRGLLAEYPFGLPENSGRLHEYCSFTIGEQSRGNPERSAVQRIRAELGERDLNLLCYSPG
jgi:hypothetical protein